VENSQIIFNFVNVILIIVGWLAVFWFSLKQQKEQLKNNTKLKVYEELYDFKKELDEKSNDLGILLNPFSIPFLDMEYVDRTIPPSQRNFQALKFWNKYLRKLSERTSAFVGAYLKFWIHCEMWIGVIPKLKKAKKELFEIQLSQLTNKLYKHHQYLQNLQIQNYWWEKWDREDIKRRTEKISEEFDQIAIGYVDDFMVEIHNILISSLIGYKKITRENFKNLPKNYKVLTQDGIKEIS